MNLLACLPDILEANDHGINPVDFLTQENIIEDIKTPEDLEPLKDAFPGAYRQLKKILFPSKGLYSFEAITDAIKAFNPSNDFTSNLFIKRRFPAGSLSYLGARPGRGKTTAMVNFALDAINQGRKTVFCSFEETPKQIFIRFINALIKNNPFTTTDGEFLQALQEIKAAPRTSFYDWMRPQELTKDEKKDIIFTGAYNNLKRYMEEGNLSLYAGYEAGSLEAFKDFLEGLEPYTVVLVDYIQLVPPPVIDATQTRQIQIGKVSQVLADIAKTNNLVILAGAQLNREQTHGQTLKDPDTFNEAGFRECGNIEQDAHITIDLGKDPSGCTIQYFYTCMKDREAAPDAGNMHLLETDMALSWIKDAGTEYHYPSKQKKNKEDNQAAPKTTTFSINLNNLLEGEENE